MSVPAIRSLKKSFDCKITLLCSESARAAVQLIAEVDDHIACDLPWYKSADDDPALLASLINRLKAGGFDGCVVFNVYSQNPAPLLLLAYMAEIPLRAAYARENLYHLLTHWLPDDEPYGCIRHQVERELRLVEFLGAEQLLTAVKLKQPKRALLAKLFEKYELKLRQYIIVHAGVSEVKRRYPRDLWQQVLVQLVARIQMPIVLTGIASEKDFLLSLKSNLPSIILTAGELELSEFTALMSGAKATLTVNTGPMHLAAALKIPTLALYAQTNPQHTPWQCLHRILYFSVPEELKSRNEVIRYVDRERYQTYWPLPSAATVVEEFAKLLGLIDEI